MGSGAGLLFRDADVLGAGRCDVRVGNSQVTELGPGLPRRDEIPVECAGAALLPGLHDHHCHLLATAAASRSVDCGPPAVTTRQELSERLRAALPRNGWLRGVGYDDSVAGDLDAAGLDRLGPAVPTRIQHRGGALWIINGPGIRALGLDGDGITGPDGADLEGAEGAGLDGAGIERDAAGRPTGRLWRADGWLRQRLAEDDVPDVRGLSRQLASCGVTGVTDATSDLPPSALRTLLAGGFQQRITSLGLEHGIEQVGLGPRKIMVSDHALPVFGELAERIRAARPRPVALHCVTRAALVLTLAVLQETGARRGDRIEHAAVAPPPSPRWAWPWSPSRRCRPAAATTILTGWSAPMSPSCGRSGPYWGPACRSAALATRPTGTPTRGLRWPRRRADARPRAESSAAARGYRGGRRCAGTSGTRTSLEAGCAPFGWVRRPT